MRSCELECGWSKQGRGGVRESRVRGKEDNEGKADVEREAFMGRGTRRREEGVE